MPPPEPLFVKAQITPSALTTLKAMSVSHARVRVLASVRLALSAVIAVAGAVVTVTALPAAWITVLGAVWAGVYSIGLASWVEMELNRAAKLQEMFEAELFGLGWNTVLAGPVVRSEDVSRLSGKFARRKISDDWDHVPNLPRPFNVLARQIQNLGWGSRIRRRYANVIQGVLLVWTLAGAVVGFIGDFTVGEIVLRWYIPSLGGLLLGIDVVRQQRAIAKDRERACVFAEEEVLKAATKAAGALPDADLILLSRQVQDVLFRTRCQAPRAPSGIFYRAFYGNDEIDFRAPVQRLAMALAPPGGTDGVTGDPGLMSPLPERRNP
ncbi:S-4TM family putative pore-forming effector [Micromonospora sp. NPDC049114]|uniref:S-4TM family putative pore-forming effector n=1 Tax=unclassified Micromonospora TaxID=2617518 RepID=UPI0033D5743C